MNNLITISFMAVFAYFGFTEHKNRNHLKVSIFSTLFILNALFLLNPKTILQFASFSIVVVDWVLLAYFSFIFYSSNIISKLITNGKYKDTIPGLLLITLCLLLIFNHNDANINVLR